MHSILNEPPVPTQLKSLWPQVEAGRLSSEEFMSSQENLLKKYADVWTDALLLPGQTDLGASLCRELGALVGCGDLSEVENRCRAAVKAMKNDWEERVREGDEASVIDYYDQSQHYAYELMWWHSLKEDLSPLAYVSALSVAGEARAGEVLDFGSGVGSGSLLFARHGARVSLADVSSTLLEFAQRRLAARDVPAAFIDLKSEELPENAYDFVTAMDVFEHIAEPEKTAATLAKSIRPGGVLFGRFAAEEDEERPSHIARDFAPTFEVLAELGFAECWRDEWLWGHQAFQKAA